MSNEQTAQLIATTVEVWLEHCRKIAAGGLVRPGMQLVTPEMIEEAPLV